jgi:3'-phosphoadenosine 5'-phosphosulfate sulfotransferase (PAPS reductase)/FAD synthetase
MKPEELKVYELSLELDERIRNRRLLNSLKTFIQTRNYTNLHNDDIMTISSGTYSSTILRLLLKRWTKPLYLMTTNDDIFMEQTVKSARNLYLNEKLRQST